MQNGITVNVSQLQLTRITDAAPPRLNGISLGLLSHLRSFMSNFGIAHRHAFISKHGTSTVASSSSGASYHTLAKPDSHTKSKSLALWDYCYGIVFMVNNEMARISARSSVSSLQSSSVHLDPSLMVGSVAPMHCTVASLRETPELGKSHFLNVTSWQRKYAGNAGLAPTASVVRWKP